MIKNSNSTRFYSENQEKRVAKKLGGRVVANSGATAFNKGDVIANNILIECKTSIEEKSSFSIKKEWLEKNKKEAFSMGFNNNALAFSFGNDKDYIVIDIDYFKKLLEGEN